MTTNLLDSTLARRLQQSKSHCLAYVRYRIDAHGAMEFPAPGGVLWATHRLRTNVLSLDDWHGLCAMAERWHLPSAADPPHSDSDVETPS